MGDSLLYIRKERHLKEALGGNQFLIRNGKVISQLHKSFRLTRYHRTTASTIDKHTVLFAVIDDKRLEYDNRMPLDELVPLIQNLGAEQRST